MILFSKIIINTRNKHKVAQIVRNDFAKLKTLRGFNEVSII